MYLRSARAHFDVPAVETSKFTAHGFRGGGATAAVPGGLSPEDVAHLASVRDINWLVYYNRIHLRPRLRASRALGL